MPEQLTGGAFRRSAPDDARRRQLRRAFDARSVAVVGASRDPSKWGYMTLDPVLSAGFEGAVYPVNPKGGEILGLPVFARLEDVPEPPDLVIVSLPAPAVSAVLRDAARAGAGTVVILATGFREAGNPGLQDEIVAIARAGGLRLIGPNVMGLTYLPRRLNTMPWPRVDVQGPLGIIGQSGTVTAALAEWAAQEGLGISASLNTGNQADVCEADFLECLMEDDLTKAVALHVEGLKDGRGFLRALSQASKPVVVLKAGRSPTGRVAAVSHTASLAGDDGVFTGACRQFGAVRAESLTELYDSAKALATLDPSRGRRVLFLSTSGGSGTLAVDQAERLGLTVPALPPGFVDDLRERGLSPASSGNPLDLDTESAGGFEEAASLAIASGFCDYIVLGFGDPIPGAADVAERLRATFPGGILAYYLGGGEVQQAEVARMHAMGIPVFPTPERTSQALSACVIWARARPGREPESEEKDAP
jgi:acyl-CoA synthetase (NDP forming)